jgi:hypothetical protein
MPMGAGLATLAVVLFLATPAHAVEPEQGGGLLINSEFMIMDAFGDDLNVFEVKIEDDDGNSVNRGQDLESDVDFGWRGDLQYVDDVWGLGISGFWFETEGDEDVVQPGANILGGTVDEVSVRGVNESNDCFNDYCYADMDSELEVWMIDLYGIRRLVGTPDVLVDLQFGLRLAEFDWDTDGIAARIDDPATGDTNGDPVGLAGNSDVEDTLVGPFLALFTEGRYGRFRVQGQLSQAVVFGELGQDVQLFQFESGDTLSSLMLEESAVLSRDQDATIPITDVRIKIGYDILDNLTLGFGGYASTWFNVPEPPNSEAEDFSTGAASLRSDEENLTFLGASFSLEYRFSGGSLPDLGSWMP